ncbi:MAG: hypothetical protein FJZ95_02190 [Chloroflexi bacterium]|nr:hypothetical protein [Chloroflexota bacterium]
MRKWLVRRGLKGLWFLEFQEHGAPHYHVFVNGRVDKSEVAQEWYQIVGSGDENHLRAGTRVEAIRGPHAVPTYAAKYAAKFQQKQVPEGYTDVGRFWGTFGGLKVRSETVLSGSFADIAPAARLARRASGAKRRKFAKRKIRDNGRFSLVAYGAAEALRCGLPNVAVAWFLRRDWVIEPKAI